MSLSQKMNKIKRGIIGLYYLLSHPKILLYIGYHRSQYGKLVGEVKAFRLAHSDICVPFEEFLKRNNWNFSSINFYNTRTEIGSISQYELFVLCSLIKASKAKIIFEIGTFYGQTTYNISKNIPKNGYIYTLDIDQKIDKKENILALCGDSQYFNFTNYHNKIDCMFIDGDHNYNCVLYDSKNAFKCVKKDGLIIWHDFNHTHLHSSKAIIEFCGSYNLKPFWIDGTSFIVSKVHKNY